MAQADNPWRTLSSRDIYDNPWIRVTEHDVINPGGGKSLYGKVSFKNVACGIIPLNEELQTWLVGQYRYTIDQYSWEIPMGGVPMREDLLAGAKRELKEETGLSADRWEKILTTHISNSITDETGTVFVAESLREGEPAFDETEDLAIRKLPLRDAVAMAANGEITDLLSVAGLLRVAALRSL